MSIRRVIPNRVARDLERRRACDPMTDGPWGVRRCCVEDPDGTVIDVHAHT